MFKKSNGNAEYVSLNSGFTIKLTQKMTKFWINYEKSGVLHLRSENDAGQIYFEDAIFED